MLIRSFSPRTPPCLAGKKVRPGAGPMQGYQRTSTNLHPRFGINMAAFQMPPLDSKMKMCFVTTGATAPFTGLIESVLQPASIDALRKGGYTHLLIQYGSAKHVMDEHAKMAFQRMKEELGNEALVIDGFDFDQDGLKAQFKMVQQSNGLIISHAGMFHLAGS